MTTMPSNNASLTDAYTSPLRARRGAAKRERWGSMKALVAMLCLLGTGAASAEVLSERSKEVGSGFREVMREETNPPGHWEGVGHFAFLYYKDMQLSRTTIYSIAPSGRFALYQDGPTGDLVLFEVVSKTKKTVLPFPGSLARAFGWAEKDNSVAVTLESGKVVKVRTN